MQPRDELPTPQEQRSQHGKGTSIGRGIERALNGRPVQDGAVVRSIRKPRLDTHPDCRQRGRPANRRLQRPQVGAPSVPEWDESPSRLQDTHRLASNRGERLTQFTLPAPQPLQQDERIIGLFERSEPVPGRLLTDHETGVENRRSH